MDSSRKYFDPQTLAKLDGLSLRARTIVEGYVAGLHRSPFRGFSIEFAEHREYVPGDDLRYVDWKVFGKSDRIYLKQYEEETNFACYFLLDTSESMSFRSEQAPCSKLDYARMLIGALSYLVLQQQDAVGLAVYDAAVRQFVRAAGHAAHFRQLIHVLESAPCSGETALGPIFHDLAERMTKRGLVVICSDLFDQVETMLLGLKHLRHRRHDVVVLQIIDPTEQDFPFEDPTLFKGLENWPEQMTDPRALRSAYRAEFQTFLDDVQRGCRDLRLDYQLLRTDMPLDVGLRQFLVSRAAFRTAV